MLEVGIAVDVDPIPPIPENTVPVPAGNITFKVEYRVLDDELIAENYGERAQEVTQGRTVADNGVSVHVFGTEDDLEYLRFDCFEDGPHYHYVRPHEKGQRVVMMDTVACGDPLEWSLRSLRTRLAPMLVAAGGAALADVLDRPAIEAALDEVAAFAETALTDAISSRTTPASG